MLNTLSKFNLRLKHTISAYKGNTGDVIEQVSFFRLLTTPLKSFQN